METKSSFVYRTLTLRRARERGWDAYSISARQLFELIVESGADLQVYQSFGHVGGEEMFGTTIFRANHEDARVDVLDSNGRVVAAYPVEAAPNHATPGRLLFTKLNA